MPDIKSLAFFFVFFKAPIRTTTANLVPLIQLTPKSALIRNTFVSKPVDTGIANLKCNET